MKFLRSKFVIILVAITFLLFLTNDFGIIDIERTAIIVALGIDYDEASAKYNVSAQIAIPQETKQTTDGQDTLVSGKGATIGEAMDDIGVTTGWYPMLSFCNLVLLSKNAINGDVMDIINYFVRTDKIEDSAIIAGCEEKAIDVLSSKTPLDTISSFAIAKILSKDIAKLERIADSNVKDFSKGYYGKSESSYMPLIKRIEVKNGSAKENDGKQQDKDKENDKKYVFDATETMMFVKGRFVGTLTSDETLFFNFKYKDSIDTFLELNDVEYEGEKTSVLLSINEKKKDYKLIIENGIPVYHIDIKLLCQIEDTDNGTTVSNLISTANVPENILKTTEEKIKSTIESMFKKIKDLNCDLFNLKETLYKYHYDKYRRLNDDFLKNVLIKTDVKCEAEMGMRL